MPLIAFALFNFAVGIAAAMAAARELRASPRATQRTEAFRAVAFYDALIAVPVVVWFVVRFPDWSLSYVVDGGRVPSLVFALFVVAHAAMAFAGYFVGASLLRDHRQQVLPIIIAAAALCVLVGAVIARHRLGVVGTFAQYRGGFGLRRMRSTGLVAPFVAVLLAWFGAVGHLLWSVARRAQ